MSVFAFVTFGISAGLIWFASYQHFCIQPLALLDTQTIHLSVTASDYNSQGRYSYQFDGVVSIEGKRYQIHVYQADNTPIRPGDVLEGDFRLRLTTPEGNRSSDYFQGNGIFLIGSQKGEGQIRCPEKTPLWCIPAILARMAKETLETYFPKDTVSFAKALLLGDTTDLSYEDDTVLKVSGIRHIAAVSGLHVSILFGLLLLLLRKRRIPVLLISIPVFILFAAITGFTPSVVRACLMTFLMALGAVIHDEYDGLTGLSFASLIILLMNPYAVNSVSFQLSVASVAGILLFASPIYQWICGFFPNVKKGSFQSGFRNWLAGSVSVSVSAALISTPLSAYYFGTISLIGPLTNLITIWVIAVLFCGIGMVCIFGNLIPGVCRLAACALSYLIRFVMGAARFCASIPFAAVYTESCFVIIWLVGCYLMIALFLLLRKRFLRVFLSIGAIGLAAAIFLSVFLPSLDRTRLTVMDVGEGQCILLQSGGHTLLIDCGGDTDTNAANKAAQTLLSQGIRKLDAIALTHYDYDHAGGINNLLSRVETEKMYLPDMEPDGFLKNLNWKDSEPILIRQITKIPFGDGMLTFSGPGNQKTDNENCMCILFESEECDILITGDRSRSGEKHLMESMELPDVDILIAGHHGSKKSTSYELLQAVTPETVIISVGANNTYGHPAQEVLDRLEEMKCTVYRTDQMGSVLVRR